MIFWILTVIIAVAWLWCTVYLWLYDWTDGFMTLVIGGLLAGLAWILLAVLLVAAGIPHLLGGNKAVEHEAKLKALGSDSSVEGRFYFLGGGYVEGKRVLSFIRENSDGSFTPDQADGASSKVFEEDGVQPKMVTTDHIADYWWLAPEVRIGSTHEFTIPTGSVAESYEVSP